MDYWNFIVIKLEVFFCLFGINLSVLMLTKTIKNIDAFTSTYWHNFNVSMTSSHRAMWCIMIFLAPLVSNTMYWGAYAVSWHLLHLKYKKIASETLCQLGPNFGGIVLGLVNQDSHHYKEFEDTKGADTEI